jgi:hypothetical protein
MSKCILPVSEELVAEFQQGNWMPSDFTLLGMKWSDDRGIAYFTWFSERVPETVNGELPELMLIMLNHKTDSGEYVAELSKIELYGEFEPGKKETRILFEKVDPSE